jgi:hypothetical protein
MISAETIKSNEKIFKGTVAKYNLCNELLLTNLGNELFLCPASTMLSMHNAFPGGLIDHVLRVAKKAQAINDYVLDPSLKQSKESLLRVCFLHSIGKVGLYTPNTDDWSVKKLGKMYEFNEERISMMTAERSILYILNSGNKLSDIEYQAIINYDKSSNDKIAEWHNEVLGEVLRMAIKLAIIEEKELNNNTK